MQRIAKSVLAATGLFLLAMAFVGPWWSLHVSRFSPSGFVEDGNLDYRVFGAELWTDSQSVPLNYTLVPDIASMFATVSGTASTATILGLLVTLSSLVPRQRARWFRPAQIAVGVATFVLGLIGPLFIMTNLPTASPIFHLPLDAGPGSIASSFWGSTSVDYDRPGNYALVSWGAGWAWYSVVAGAVLFLFWTFWCLRTPRPAETA